MFPCKIKGINESEDYIVLSIAEEGDFYDCYQLNLVEIEKEINYEFVGQVIGNQGFALSLYKFENSVLLAMKDKIVLYDCEERRILSEVPEKFPSNIVVKLSEDVDSDHLYVQYVSGYNVISRSYMLKDNSFQCAKIEKLEYTTHYSICGLLLRTGSTNVNQLGVDSVSFNEFNFDEHLNYMPTNDYQLDRSEYFRRLAIYKVEESDKLNIEFSKISVKKA